MSDWKDSVAFITGGAQGIGLGIARALSKRGVRLALADIDETALARAGRELSQLTVVETHRLDVRDRTAYATVADQVESTLGPVGLLFNNAGIVPYASASDLRYENWDLSLDVNLGGVINGIQTFLPRMIERGNGGYIVNTASGAGLAANDNVLYVTGKYAVVGLSESLRLAVERHGIDVSVLCPGPVATNIVRNTAQAAEEGNRIALPAKAREAVEAFIAGGNSIDAVGEMVLAGMEARAMWIHTDDIMRPLLQQRTRELLESLPEPTADPTR